MKKTKWIMLILAVGILLQSKANSQEIEVQGKSRCMELSDRFETYNPQKWYEVLLYSKAQGVVYVKNGQLVLKTPQNEAVEIQVYSQFVYKGNFDVQVDYEIPKNQNYENCRFNTGIVAQGIDDEISYKCYIAFRSEKGLHYRSRIDRFGETNIESSKGKEAPPKGTLRLIRAKDRLSFLALENGKWETVYQFTSVQKESLRLRFKLQTGDGGDFGMACRVVVYFDNYLVNDCDTVFRD